MDENIYFFISDRLISWYNANKRDLPWREVTDPYHIWISEIILQQTRVNQGYNYYVNFIRRFPTVTSLAQAEEDEVLKYWQGLGYYSRARNLHKAAKRITTDFNGIFPATHSDVLTLSGVGEYTAAAICSFAYNQPYAVVDGNVYRVISRLFGIGTPIDSTKGKKEFTELAQQLLDKNCPALHNQAIMEFGALQCTPSSPDCADCPLQTICHAYELKETEQFPVKEKKTKVSNRYFNYLFIENGTDTYLKKRKGKDIWTGLYEFPLIETDKLLSGKDLLKNPDFQQFFKKSDVKINRFSHPIKHVLSHQIISAQFISISINDKSFSLQEYICIPLNDLEKYPVSRLIEIFLETR